MMWQYLDYFAQGLIVLTGIVAVTLVSSQDPKTRFYAGLAGLFGEPFWFYTAMFNGQYGILILIIVYGVGHSRVVMNNYKAIPEGSFLFSKEYFRV